MEHDQLDLHDRGPRRPAPKSQVGGPSGGLLGLQQSAGNAAVSSMLAQRIPADSDVGDPWQGRRRGAATPESAGIPESTGDAGPSTAGGGTGDAGPSATGGGINELGPVAKVGTLIADSIVASSYTPGAGNVM